VLDARGSGPEAAERLAASEGKKEEGEKWSESGTADATVQH
jgi:hypothetical protein